MPDYDRTGTAERSYPTSEVEGGVGGGREEIPCVQGQGRRREELPRVRGGGREDQPHAVAARAQEGLEELSHVEGQEGQR